MDVRRYILHGDGRIERLPYFSELFPTWDIPVEAFEGKPQTRYIEPDTIYNFNATLLSPASAAQNSPALTIPNPRNYIMTFVDSLGVAPHCNIGYYKMTNNTLLAYASYLEVDDDLYFGTTNLGRINIGIRVSTYSNLQGSGHFVVYCA